MMSNSCEGCDNSAWHVFMECSSDGDEDLLRSQAKLHMCCREIMRVPIGDITHRQFIEILMAASVASRKKLKAAEAGDENEGPSTEEDFISAFEALCTSKQIQARVIPEQSFSYHGKPR